MSAPSNDHVGGYAAGDTPASELKPPPALMTSKDIPAKHPPTRVVLVKPSDVLVVGGAGSPDGLREATKWFKEATGISLLVCADDVTISTAPAGLYALMEYCRDQADREDETWAGGWRAAHANLALRIERLLSGQAEAEGRL